VVGLGVSVGSIPISVGVGVSFVTSNATMERMVDTGSKLFEGMGSNPALATLVANTDYDSDFILEGDGTGFGYNLGVIYRMEEKYQFGISYRGAMDIDYEGTAKFKHKEEAIKNSHERMKDKVITEVKKTFRPEFLNRIDETVVFHSLSRENIFDIAQLQLSHLAQRIGDRGIRVQFEEQAVRYLADQGYDVHFGARPLKRCLQNLVETPLAKEIVQGNIRDGDSIVVDVNAGNVKINYADPQTGPLAANIVPAVIVIGGPGDNLIDLSGILLADWDVGYVWHGPREQALGGFDPETAVYLQPIHTENSITIYKVDNSQLTIDN